MQSFASILNGMLISVYHNIMRVEEEFLQKCHRVNLSIREMHMIEFIGEDRQLGKTPGEIADYLKVARPSVTVAVRKLTEKGLLVRSVSEDDGRVVRVSLTKEGRRVFGYHARFHMLMVREIEQELREDEKEMLIRVMEKLDRFFERSVEAAT